MEGRQDIPTFFLTCLLWLYTTHIMLYTVAIVGGTQVHHFVHYKIIRTYNIILLMLTATMQGQLQLP